MVIPPPSKTACCTLVHTQNSILKFYKDISTEYDHPLNAKCVLSCFINMQTWCYFVCTLVYTVLGALSMELLLLRVTTIQKLHFSSSIRMPLSVSTNGRTSPHSLANSKVQTLSKFYDMRPMQSNILTGSNQGGIYSGRIYYAGWRLGTPDCCTKSLITSKTYSCYQ